MQRLFIILLLLVSCATRGPQPIASIAIPGPVVRLSQSNGSFFIVQHASSHDTVYVVDARRPADPRITGKIAIDGEVVDLVASAKYLFVATADKRAALQIFNWKTGALLARYAAPTQRGGTAVGFWPMGLLYLRTENARGTRSEFILDISDPTSPKKVTQRELSNAPKLPQPLLPPTSYVDASGIVEIARSSTDPRLTALLTNEPRSELVLVRNLDSSLTFGDANGDGLFQLSCLGNSNTFPDLERRPLSWCNATAPLIWNPNYRIANHAFFGAQVTEGQHSGKAQLETAFAWGSDAVILAFGTNDLALGRKTPSEIVATYQRLVEQAEKKGLTAYVATTPPTYQRGATWAAQVQPLNSLLEQTFPPEQLIDFHSGFTQNYFLADGVHINPAGQELRAERAAARLVSPTARP